MGGIEYGSEYGKECGSEYGRECGSEYGRHSVYSGAMVGRLRCMVDI